jgi:4-hydroxybenzoate polyprenyltransferase
MLAWLIALVLAAAIVFYDDIAKRYLAGSLVMGGCRYLNWLLGLSVTGLNGRDFLLAVPTFLYVVSLTVLSSIETSANSRAPLAACAVGIVTTGAVVCMLMVADVLPQRWPMLAVIAGSGFILYRLAQTYRDFDADHIQSAMKVLIMSVIPLDAILVFAGAPWWGGVVVLALMLPARSLGRWVYVT